MTDKELRRDPEAGASDVRRDEQGLPEAPSPAAPGAAELSLAGGGDRGRVASPGVLELVYGTLFDPVATFRRVAEHLPMGKVLLIFSMVKLLSFSVLLTGGFFSPHFLFGDMAAGPGGGAMEAAARAMTPALVALGLIYEYAKWFVYGGVLYLLAGLSGGGGRAAGVLAVTALASLPALLFLPVQILLALLEGAGRTAGAVNVLVWFVVLIWGAVLVALGLRETQGLSTGRSVAVALAPAAGIIALFLLLLVIIIAVAAPMGLYFSQFYDIN